MKRPVLTALFLCAVAVLPGCPIYDHEDDGCYRDSDCDTGYSCDRSSGQCFLASDGNSEGTTCRKPSDCVTNSTCSSAGECVSGDCSFSGCVSGYTCDAGSGTWACVLSSSIGSAGAAGFSAAGAVASEAGASGSSTASAGGAAGAN